jgi:hypothetical protein
MGKLQNVKRVSLWNTIMFQELLAPINTWIRYWSDNQVTKIRSANLELSDEETDEMIL